MDRSSGEVAAKRAKPPDGGEDRLSALYDDLLLRILALLDTTDAVRTSVLAHRWKSLWRSVPEVRFNLAPDGNRIRDVLDGADDATVLRRISVTTKDAASDSVAAWLPAAARRLFGELLYCNLDPKSATADDEEEEEEEVEDAGERGVVEVPCFEKATKILLMLRRQGLAIPSQGVFNKLTNLSLSGIRFHGSCNLGNAVSEPRCPCLQKLNVFESRGLDNLSIHSKSLRKIKLVDLGRSMQQLTIVAPNLKKLGLVYCLLDGDERKPVANISAPQIVSLMWADAYDPESVHLGNLGHLQALRTKLFWLYGPQLQRDQNQCVRFLQRFKVLQSLNLILINQPDEDGNQHLLGDIKVLPQIMFLHMDIFHSGHGFGAGSFNVLRMCSGLRRLSLELYTIRDLEAQAACPLGCICDGQEKWKTEELILNHLEVVEITGLRGSQYEVSFVKQVFNWGKALKRMELIFSSSMSENMAKDLCQVFKRFTRPEICMQCYMQKDKIKML